jgi:ubiquitin C-terminal hydrolase
MEEPMEKECRCDTCGFDDCVVKKISLLTTPDILIIQLKLTDASGRNPTKIETNMSCPLTLDMAKYMVSDYNGPSSEYKLYAVSRHKGDMSSSGHYTTCCLVDDKWYMFDDETVVSVNGPDILSSTPYCMYYERVGPSSNYGGLEPASVDSMPVSDGNMTVDNDSDI